MRTGFYLMYSLQIFVERILHAESMDTLFAVRFDCCILRIFDDRRDDICDFLEVIFLESSGGQSRGAETNAARDEWRESLERNGVSVCGDADLIENRLCDLTCDADSFHISEEDMGIGAAGNDADAILLQLIREAFTIAFLTSQGMTN